MNGPGTMTVAELREWLLNFRDDQKVVIVADYGDIAHTMQALSINEVDESEIHETAYSKSGWAIGSEYDEDEGPDEDNPVSCPRGDPSCTSKDDECHDACEEPERYVVLKS